MLQKEKAVKFIEQFFRQDFFRSGYVQWALICSIILNFLGWGIMVYFIRPVDFPIILHYNVYFGVDLIGDWWQAYALPLIGLTVLAINGILGFLFYAQKERLISHVLLLASSVVQIVIVIGVAGLAHINY